MGQRAVRAEGQQGRADKKHHAVGDGPVLLLDGPFLLYRAHFALPHMETSGGFPTSALYGVVKLLLKLLREESPSGALAAAEGGGVKERRRTLPGYKVGRAAPPQAIQLQSQQLQPLLAAFGIATEAQPKAEADDILASAARQLQQKGQLALIVTGDMDLLQMVGDSVQVLVPGRGKRAPIRYSRLDVLQRDGILPEQRPDFQALVGDQSDRIPGIAGIGPVAAAKLLRDFGSLDGVLDNLDRIPEERIRKALEQGKQLALRYRDTAILKDNLPLDLSAERIALRPVEHLPQARAFLERLEFRSLIQPLEEVFRKLANETKY